MQLRGIKVKVISRTIIFIKNSIVAVTEEIGNADFNTKLNEERNKGTFVMSSYVRETDRLLFKGNKLARKVHNEEI